MKPSFTLQLADISTYRTQLMGFATVMIIACHAAGSGVQMHPLLARILQLGNYGVDIFLFLSGLGLYYSLKKSDPATVCGALYYKKRFFRVYIPYLLIYIPYALILVALGRYTFGDCLLSWSALEFWFFHRGAWFVSLIVIIYLLSPLLYKALSSKNKWLWTVVLILVLTALIKIPAEDKSIVFNLKWALCRVPSFILGMAIAQGCQDKKNISAIWILLLTFLGVVGWEELLIGYGGAWMIVPLFIFVFIFLLKKIERVSFVNKSLKFLGKVSLESYLTNVTINTLLRILIPAYISSSLFYGRYLEYTIVIVVGLLVAELVNRWSNRLMSRFGLAK